MSPTVSLVTKVEFVTEVIAVAGVAAVDGAPTMVGVVAEDGDVIAVGACCPKGTLEWLRIQVYPHHCGRKKEIGLMAYR